MQGNRLRPTYQKGILEVTGDVAKNLILEKGNEGEKNWRPELCRVTRLSRVVSEEEQPFKGRRKRYRSLASIGQRRKDLKKEVLKARVRTFLGEISWD